ncbi:hypothetical protein IMSHALPRED_002249 [Imshaugia aleurites]|uniref:Uncharacterized protein n=1 Tax=Imshaugia aleurites TaxID=172621 RepID=A0A8H3J5E7_9LECA|nr:hypothetical protein IMSHALPRED_002249 [Imshaugia aleurites]
MGKTKRKHPDIEETLSRPWCYYCERDFDDLKILINHQKAKHFKCERCGRRLNTAGGLSVHMTQVHKETLTIIENALPNRSGLDVEIFGMEGIPDDVAQSHNQRVLQQFAQAEAERRAATGNLGPTGGGGAAKKPKFESPSDLKKRLAEHKAKKAAEEAAGISSGGNTPGGAAQGNQSPGLGQSPGNYVSRLRTSISQLGLRDFDQAGSPGFPPQQQQQQMPFGGPPQNSSYSAFPQPYAQQPPPYQQPQSPFPPQQQSFGPPQNQVFGPPQQFPQQGGPGFQPQFQNGPPPQFQNGPPPFANGPPQFQNGPPTFQNGPPNQFSNGPSPFQNGPPPQFETGPPNFQNGPFGASPPPYQQNHFQPPQNHTPPQHTMPPRPGSLPPAPGLPQRPSFGAPPVNAFQMQQMHQGQLPGPPNPTDHSHNAQQRHGQSGGPGGPAGSGPPPSSLPAPLSANATSLDDLVSGAAKDADKAAGTVETKPEVPKVEEPAEEKKGKKEKDKNMKLVYSDNEVSPEEKMAQMPRYAFAPSG